MAPIKVVIHGATGRMGTETVNAVCREDDLSLVGATCGRERGRPLALPNGGEVPLSTTLEEILAETSPDVVVDFTNAAVCRESVAIAAGQFLQHRSGCQRSGGRGPETVGCPGQ